MVTRFLGILGLVLTVFGFAGAMVLGWATPLIFIPLIHLTLGILALLLWFFKHGLKDLHRSDGIVRGRVARFSANAITYGVVFVGILVAINLIVAKNNSRVDLTEAGVYSLAPQSAKVLSQLDKPLAIVGIKAPGGGKELDDLLKLYKDGNTSKVTTEVFNPETKPHLIDKYGFKPGNVIHLSYGEGEAARSSQLNQISEQEITNAILKLIREKTRKVYFVQGHGEPGLQGKDPEGFQAFASALEDEQFSSESVVLSQKGSVPDDAAVLVLAAAKKALLPEEKSAVIEYVKKGGRLLLFAQPRFGEDVASIASEFGITVGNDVVVDKVQRLFSGPALGVEPIIMTYEPHPITKDFTENTVALFHMSRSVKVDESKKEAGASYSEFAKTGPDAWGETNLSALFDSDKPVAEKNDDDAAGPVSLAVAYEKKVKAGEGSADAPQAFDTTARVVVFGSTSFAMTQRFGVYSNRDVILNAMNWLSGEEGGLTIRPRELRTASEPIARSVFINILLTAFLIPELILVVGLYIWWKRRVVSA